jgi:tyrosinase
MDRPLTAVQQTRHLDPASLNMCKAWTFFVAIQLLLASVTVGTPLQSDQRLQNRQSNESIVTGVGWRDGNGTDNAIFTTRAHSNVPKGNVPLRREVRDLENNHPDQWNLYLLGLDALQQTDQNDPLSFYGLARKSPLASD